MKNKAWLIVMVLIVAIATKPGAFTSRDLLDVEGTGLTEIVLPKGSTVVAMLDDSVIFLINETFNRYYFESGEFVTLGKTDVIRGRVNCRWIDDVMAVYPPINSWAEAGNPLSVIDFEANRIRRFAGHPASNPWNAFLTPHKGNVLALISGIKSYISLYDIKTGNSEVVLEASMDAIGSQYHAIDSYGDKVYTVYTSRPSAGAGKSTVIRVYDGDFNYLKDIALNEIEHVAEAMAYHIIDFRVFGKYIYWRSASPGSSIIAEIKDGGYLSVLYQSGDIISGPFYEQLRDGTVAIFGPDEDVSYDFGGKPLNLAFNSDKITNTQVFFEERSSRVVLFNTDEGILSEINLPIADVGYETVYMAANGNMVLICAVPIGFGFGNERYFLYYITFD